MHYTRARVLRVLVLLAPVLAGLVGAWLGMALLGRTTTSMGPFDVRLEAGFGRGETKIALPPFGHVVADTHAAPLSVSATLWDLNVSELGEMLNQTTASDLVATVESDALAHMRPFAVRLLLAGLAGALVGGLLVFRTDWRRVALATLAALVAVGGTQGVTWATYRPGAFHQPTFAGSLEMAPKLVGPVEEVTDRIEDFRSELRRVVGGAVQAYTRLEPNFGNGHDQIRVLHISDIHLSPLGIDFALQLARGFKVDFVIDTGDLTSYGTPPEQMILGAIPRFERPYVFVRGNHDSVAVQEAMRAIPNAHVLDGETVEVDGLLVYGLGHPAYTEDREATLDHKEFVELATGAGAQIRADLRAMDRRPDIVAVHDDRMAETLAGRVPLVVSGHYHRALERIASETVFLRAGSAGGSGVNVFSGDGVPFSAQILSFESGPRPRLVAYDTIQQSPESGSLQVRRHLVADRVPQAAPPS